VNLSHEEIMSRLESGELTSAPVVYYLKILDGGLCYVGSSIRLLNRIRAHLRELIRGTHHSQHLQNKVNKVGIDNLVWGVLEVVENPDDLIRVEQKWIDSHGHYNCSPTAGSPKGAVFNITDEDREQRRQRGATIKARTDPELWKESRVRALSWCRGRSLSDQHKEKISKASKGKPKSDAAASNIKQGVKKMWDEMSDEDRKKRVAKRLDTNALKSDEEKAATREKISASCKGRTSNMKGKTHSEGARKVMSEKAKQRRHTEESKRKLSAIFKGCKHSEEAKRKISEAAKKRWANKTAAADAGSST
jgi:group I intron endonuclease